MDHIHFTGPTYVKFLIGSGVNKLCLICAEMCFQFYILCFTSSGDMNKSLWGGGGSEPITLISNFSRKKIDEEVFDSFPKFWAIPYI